jgi:hypothetical protein
MDSNGEGARRKAVKVRLTVVGVYLSSQKTLLRSTRALVAANLSF